MSRYQIISNARTKTDYIMPLWLPFLPVIVSIIGGATSLSILLSGIAGVAPTNVAMEQYLGAVFTPFVAVAYGTGVVASILFGYVIHRLVSRFNNHVARVRALFGAVNDGGKDVVGRIGALPKRNPGEWAMLIAVFSIIPYLSIVSLVLTIYIFHSLNRDFVRLEKIEDEGFRIAGWNGTRQHETRKRNTALY